MSVRLCLILHAYQPSFPVQERWVVERIIENCYRPLVSRLLKNPGVKIAININASLTEMLATMAPDVLEGLSRMSSRGQVELLGSGAYHPIFPLIPSKWWGSQVKLNSVINSKFISPYRPVGFWPPELAVDTQFLLFLAHSGFRYAVVPESSTDGICLLKDEQKSIVLLPRNKNLSNALAFREVSSVDEFLGKVRDDGGEVILAMDMETFGEHQVEYYNFLLELLLHPDVQCLLPSDVIAGKDYSEVTSITASSWSTGSDELEKNIPFPLWYHPENSVHCLTQTALSIISEHSTELSEDEQVLLLKSQHSCQFWWADHREGRWSPPMILRGFDLMYRAALPEQKYALEKIRVHLEKVIKHLERENSH